MEQVIDEPQLDPLSLSLQSVFGYRTFRDGQKEVIEQSCSGYDCLVIMPTGGEESLLSIASFAAARVNPCGVSAYLLNERPSG